MENSIADLAARIKNGYMAKKETIIIQYSKINLAILNVLKSEGYIKEHHLEESGAAKKISVKLLYHNGKPSMIEIYIASTPGKRIYTKAKDLKPILGGLGRALLSTPKGVMTDKEARKQKVGGELLFKIW